MRKRNHLKIMTYDEFVVESSKGRDVIDFGGWGYNPQSPCARHELVKKSARSVTGVDLQRDGFARLEDWYYVSSSNPLSGLEMKGRRILMFESFEHLTCPLDFLRTFRDAGATSVAITVPNPWSTFTLYHVFRHGDAHAAPDHVGWYCPAAMRRICKDLWNIEAITPVISGKSGLAAVAARLNHYLCAYWGYVLTRE